MVPLHLGARATPNARATGVAARLSVARLSVARRSVAVLSVTTLLAAGCAPGWTPSSSRTGGDRYVSLGDSWVSGPLIGTPTGSPIDCGRSIENFPTLVATALGVSSFVDASCGGAKIANLFKPGKADLGSRTRPQFDSLDADTTLVTIGIGGNDASIASAGIKCVNFISVPLGPPPFGRPCVHRFTAGGVDEISEKIRKARPEMVKALAEIQRRSPRAEVFVLGYGAALPDTGDGCWPAVPMLPPDVSYIRAKMREVNTMLAEVASGAGDHFVDLWAATRGHDLCQPYGTAWVNGISIDPMGIPAHPNVLYHRHVAPVVAAAVRQARGD